jgi:hypothetical protein
MTFQLISFITFMYLFIDAIDLKTTFHNIKLSIFFYSLLIIQIINISFYNKIDYIYYLFIDVMIFLIIFLFYLIENQDIIENQDNAIHDLIKNFFDVDEVLFCIITNIYISSISIIYLLYSFLFINNILRIINITYFLLIYSDNYYIKVIVLLYFLCHLHLSIITITYILSNKHYIKHLYYFYLIITIPIPSLYLINFIYPFIT